MPWTVLLTMLLPLLQWLLSLLAPVASADKLPAAERAKLASVFKHMDLVRAEAIRVGMKWQDSEVQNAP